jgi:hypothetical protein
MFNRLNAIKEDEKKRVLNQKQLKLK